MTEELLDKNCSIVGRLHLGSFAGGKKGRCVQLTIGSQYCQMTFDEAKRIFQECIESIEKLEKKYNEDPPWWEKINP